MITVRTEDVQYQGTERQTDGRKDEETERDRHRRAETD